MKAARPTDGLQPYYPCEPICSVTSLCMALGVREHRLRYVADQADKLYRVAKEETKSDGSKRQTYDAMPLLKAVQNRIKERIFLRVECPSYLHGSLRTRSTRTNAAQHIGAKITFCEDIANFFPSLGETVVTAMWKGLFGCSDEVAFLLAKLTLKQGAVPQGATTSSYVANFALWAHEADLVRRLEAQGFIYTRFVDDITVSSKKRISPEKKTYVVNAIYGLLRRCGVKPKRIKHDIVTARKRMTATKLVHNTRVSLPSQRRRGLRAAVFQLEQRVAFGEFDDVLLKDINSAAVKVGQARQYHPTEFEVLRDRLRLVREKVLAHQGQQMRVLLKDE